MHRVTVRPDLQERDLVAGGDLQADLPKNRVHIAVEDNTPVLGRADVGQTA